MTITSKGAPPLARISSQVLQWYRETMSVPRVVCCTSTVSVGSTDGINLGRVPGMITPFVARPLEPETSNSAVAAVPGITARTGLAPIVEPHFDVACTRGNCGASRPRQQHGNKQHRVPPEAAL